MWEGGGFNQTGSTEKAISTPHDSDRSYVMADILRRSQSKVAEENKHNNANCCHAFKSVVMTQGKKRPNMSSSGLYGRVSRGIQVMHTQKHKQPPFACDALIPSEAAYANSDLCHRIYATVLSLFSNRDKTKALRV